MSVPAMAQNAGDASWVNAQSKAVPPENALASMTPAVFSPHKDHVSEVMTVVSPDTVMPEAKKAIVSDAETAPKAPPKAKRASNAHASLDASTRCIAMAVYHEARGESVRGQRAVADVVVNRARSGKWGPTACHVVDARHQFSNRRSWSSPVAGVPSWDKAIEIARDAVSGVVGVSSRLMNFRAARMGAGSRNFVRLGNHVFW